MFESDLGIMVYLLDGQTTMNRWIRCYLVVACRGSIGSFSNEKRSENVRLNKKKIH